MKFDVSAIMKQFGGPSSLARKLTASGHAVSIAAAHKWKERGAIPAPWLAAIVTMESAAGRAFNLSDFVSK